MTETTRMSERRKHGLQEKEPRANMQTFQPPCACVCAHVCQRAHACVCCLLCVPPGVQPEVSLPSGSLFSVSEGVVVEVHGHARRPRAHVPSAGCEEVQLVSWVPPAHL